MRNYLFYTGFLILFFSNFDACAQIYRTSWDNATERQGWTQYQLGLDSNSIWGYTPVAVLTGEVLIHSAPPASNTNVTDNWIVSPVFNFSAGGSIDSLIFNLSGVNVPAMNDRLGIYLVNGSQNPSLGSWQLLKQFDSTDYVQNAGTYQNLAAAITIPKISGSSYIAFRYKTIQTQFDAVFDALQLTVNYPNSINDFEPQKRALKINPNPTKAIFHIDIESPEKVLILNSIGEQVLVSAAADINIAHLSSGLFFIKVLKGGKIYFGQVVKN